MAYKDPAKRNAQSRRWYRANKALIKSRRKPDTYKRNPILKRAGYHRLRNRNQRHAENYKIKHGCALCPMRDPRCLDFHHLRDKTSNVSRACRQGWSLARLDAEMAKCTVLCANCHRIVEFDKREAS
jgi:hypothetical protein